MLRLRWNGLVPLLTSNLHVHVHLHVHLQAHLQAHCTCTRVRLAFKTTLFILCLLVGPSIVYRSTYNYIVYNILRSTCSCVTAFLDMRTAESRCEI